MLSKARARARHERGLLWHRRGSATTLHGLFNAVNKFPRWHFETVRDSHQQAQRGLALAALQLAVVRAINVCQYRESVLGNLQLFAFLAHDLAEGLGDCRVE